MKIKNSFQLVATVFLLLSPTAMSWAMDDSSKILTYNIASEVYYFKYEEKDVMKETGPMYGALGEINWKIMDQYALRLEGRGALGKIDYDSNGTGSVNNINDYIFEVRALAGYNAAMESGLYLEPYLGFGYRFLRDQLGGKTSTTGAAGYDRQSNYFYLPFGLNVAKNLNSDWNAKLNVEFDLLLKGRQRSELGDALAGLDTLENNQDDGWGARGSIQLAKVMGKYDLTMEPFIRYWDIGQSDTRNVTFSGTPIGVVGYEPANTTIEAGAKLGIRF